MIAYAGALRLAVGQHESPAITVRPRWDMASLPGLLAPGPSETTGQP